MPAVVNDVMSNELESGSFEQCRQLAQTATMDGDLPRALRLWQAVVARFPEQSTGWVSAAATYRALGKFPEAEALLSTVADRFQSEPQFLAEYALSAQNLRDFDSAERRWMRVINDFPAVAEGYIGLGVVLRERQEFGRSEEVFGEGLVRFPGNWALELEASQVLADKGDAHRRVDQWRDLKSKYPDRLEVYERLAKSLEDLGRSDEADGVRAEGLERFPNDADLLIRHAHAAQRRGDWHAALARWDSFATVNPMRPEGYRGAAESLFELGRFADADNSLLPAVRMFPDNETILVLSGWIATHRNEVDEAIGRWAIVRHRFPNALVGYTGAAVALSSGARYDEARSVLIQAQERFPRELDVYAGLFRVTRMARDFTAALDWARQSLHLFPDAARAHLLMSEALTASQRHTEADELLEAAIVKFPNSADLLGAYAKNAARLGDAESRARWERYSACFPDNPLGYAGRGESYRELGDLRQAREVLDEGIKRFPLDFELRRQMALTLSRQREWPAALALWAELKARNALRIQADLTHVLWQARQDLGADSADRNASSPSFTIPSVLLEGVVNSGYGDLKGLMMKFESLGDTCEFGIVQRRFGAEPLGLLRWASILPDVLALAIRNRFDGVGDPENTELLIRNGYYDTTDRRYQMLSHTFTSAAHEPRDTFFVQQCKRMQFLRRKLIDDISRGEKIFAYKYRRGITDEQAKTLYDEMRAYGGSPALLCVRQQDDAHAVGTIKQLDERLFIGHIDKFSTVDISVDIWVTLCRLVDQALRQARPD